MNDLLPHWARFCADRSEASFLPLYRATERLVWTICWRVLRDEADARDAFQAVWTRLLVHAADGQAGPADDPVALIRRLAGLEAHALRRRRARQWHREAVSMEHFDAAAVPSTAAEAAALAGLRELLGHEAGRLEEDLRVPLELHYLDGLTQREVAEALGLSASTVNDRLKRALDRLRPLLRRAGIERPEDALPALLPLAALLAPPADVSAAQVFAAARVGAGGARPLAGSSGAGMGLAGKLVPLAALAVLAMLVVPLLRGGGSPAPPGASARPGASAVAPRPTPRPFRNAAEPPPAFPAPTPAMAVPVASPRITPASAPTIGGVVVSEQTGQPLAAVTVRLGALATDGPVASEYQNQTPLASAVTSDTGEFDFAVSGPGAYSLFVDSDRYRLIDDEAFMYFRVDLGPDESARNVRLEAAEGTIIQGVVRNARTGAPLEGARIRAVNSMLQAIRHRFGVTDAPIEEAETVSAADGSFVLPAAFGERYTVGRGDSMAPVRGLSLEVDLDGFTPWFYTAPGCWIPYAPVMVTAADGELTQDICLMPTARICVRVVDPEGAPISGSRVTIAQPSCLASRAGSSGGASCPVARTNPEGMARLNVPQNVPLTLAAEASGFAKGQVDVPPVNPMIAEDPFGPPAPEKPIVMTLNRAPGTRFRYVLQDSEGRPAGPGPKILVEGEMETGNRYALLIPIREEGESVFSFELLDPMLVADGRAHLVSRNDPRFLPLDYRLAAADATAESPVALALRRREEGRRVTGRIVNGREGPVESASVGVDMDSLQVRTDADGRFDLLVAPEATLLAVRHSTLGATGIRELRDGELTLDWAQANAVAEVHFFHADSGEPFADLRLGTDEKWSQHAVQDETRSNVFYVEQGISAGTIRFLVRGPHHGSQEVRLPIPPGQNYFVEEVELPPLGPPRRPGQRRE